MKTPQQIDEIYTQLHGHAQQVSGVWSVSEEYAQELAGDDYWSAADYARERIEEDARDYTDRETATRARMYSEDGLELSDEQRDAIESRLYDEYIGDYYDEERPSYNEYFWHYLVKQIEEAEQ